MSKGDKNQERNTDVGKEDRQEGRKTNVDRKREKKKVRLIWRQEKILKGKKTDRDKMQKDRGKKDKNVKHTKKRRDKKTRRIHK